MNKYKSLIMVMFFLCIFVLSKTNSIVNDSECETESLKITTAIVTLTEGH